MAAAKLMAPADFVRQEYLVGELAGLKGSVRLGSLDVCNEICHRSIQFLFVDVEFVPQFRIRTVGINSTE